MKYLLPILFVFFASFSYSQTQTNSVLFAQCYFDIQDEQAMLNLEANLRLHPNTNVVRLDYISQRAFIITQGINTLTNDEFKSWFESFSSTVNCVQVGVYGVDVIDPYPFTNCQD